MVTAHQSVLEVPTLGETRLAALIVLMAASAAETQEQAHQHHEGGAQERGGDFPALCTQGMRMAISRRRAATLQLTIP